VSKSDWLASKIVRLPLIWGGLASLGFYALIQQFYQDSEFVHRYFASHPVEYVTMTMFFVGLAALAIKGVDVLIQSASLGKTTLGQAPAGGQSVDSADTLLADLSKTPDRLSDSYLVRRLREALVYVQRKGSADTLDEHLRYASDLDAGRMHSSFALVRIVIWAIPILGFLGTVIGITLAIAKLGPQDLDKSLPAVVHGLKVAFDTTALALGLSIILMFAQFIIDRFEQRLLDRVDDQVAKELVGRFEEYGTAQDPQLGAIRRMAETVIASSDQLVQRQAEVWKSSIEQAQQRWQQTAGSLGEQLEDALGSALQLSLKQHADVLADAEKATAEKNRKHWTELQESLVEGTQAVAQQQEEMVKHAEILKQVVEATGQVVTLETALNSNLDALSGTRNFEETVLSLSAALQLMTNQLQGQTDTKSHVSLQEERVAKPAA